MKIKYRLKNNTHDTCLIVGHLTQKQFSDVITFLEYQGVYDYEYINTKEK